MPCDKIAFGGAADSRTGPAQGHEGETGMTSRTRGRLLTLGVAGLGSAIFVGVGLPLPLLLGPMTGCLIAALFGAPLRDMGAFGQMMRTFLGVAIGSSVTWGLILSLPSHGATLALVPLFVLVIGAVGYPFFRKVMGFDHPTAFYSAMPGGLQDMLIFGEEAGGDVRAMSLVHATRVLVIVTAAPFFLTWAYNADLTRPPGVPFSTIPWQQIVLMVGAGLIGWKLAERIGLFGASILGPLILTAALSLAGVIHQRPPAEMIWAAQFFIGIAVGAKYSGITARELRVDVGAGVAVCGDPVAAILGFHRTRAVAVARRHTGCDLVFPARRSGRNGRHRHRHRRRCGLCRCPSSDADHVGDLAGPDCRAAVRPEAHTLRADASGGDIWAKLKPIHLCLNIPRGAFHALNRAGRRVQRRCISTRI